MSWVDKALKKNQIHKMIDEAMNSREYQEAKKKDQEQAALRAYCRFCLMACDYLQIKHNYKKNGMINFLKHASEVMKYTSEEDEGYFDDMNQVMIDECGIDVLETLGMKIEKEERDNE